MINEVLIDEMLYCICKYSTNRYSAIVCKKWNHVIVYNTKKYMLFNKFVNIYNIDLYSEDNSYIKCNENLTFMGKHQILSCKIPKKQSFFVLFQTLSNLLDNVNMRFRIDDPYSMKILEYTSDKNILVSVIFHLHLDTFVTCHNKEMIVCIDLNNFLNIINISNDQLSLNICGNLGSVDYEISHLEIKTNNDSHICDSMKSYEIPAHVKDIHFDAKFIIDSNTFHTICDKMTKMSSTIEIKCVCDEIIFTCTTHDHKDIILVYRQNPLQLQMLNNPMEYSLSKQFMCELSDKQDITISYCDLAILFDDEPNIIIGRFDAKQLLRLSLCMKTYNHITIFMKNDFPLAIVSYIKDLGQITCMLTPVSS